MLIADASSSGVVCLQVIAGSDKGTVAEVEKVLPAKGMIVVKGVNVKVRRGRELPGITTPKGGATQQNRVDCSLVSYVRGIPLGGWGARRIRAKDQLPGSDLMAAAVVWVCVMVLIMHSLFSGDPTVPSCSCAVQGFS